MKGIIKSYSKAHGYGFIVADGEEYFFHATSHLYKPRVGSEVEFEVFEHPKGKRATKVRRIS